MEYIEPKPVEKKKRSKGKTILIASLAGTLGLAAVGVGMYFLIDKVLLDFENIELYTYSYKYNENKTKIIGTVIEPITKNWDQINRPTRLRIPRRLGGHPVIEIADETFKEFDTTESVSFPNTIKVIGKDAFRDCTKLKTFNAPRDLESIGADAFYNTAWLNEHDKGEVMVGKFLYSYSGSVDANTIIVGSEDSSLKNEHPNSPVINLGKYTHMSDGVFQGKDGIVAVEYPATMTTVNDKMFSGCVNIEKVILPSTINYIGKEAFKGCTNLSAIYTYIESDKSLTATLNHIEHIDNYAFDDCNFSGELKIEAPVKRVGIGAYRNNQGLTKVTIEGDLAAIEDYTFAGCTNISEVKFKDSEYNADDSHIGTIGVSAFEGTSLSEFKTPFNVTKIGSKAFYNCLNLEKVTVYENYDAEGNATVYNDRSYKKETKTFGEWGKVDTIKQGVGAIDSGAFAVDDNKESKFNSLVLVDKNGAEITSNGEVHIPLRLTQFGESTFANSAITKADLSQDKDKLTKMGFSGYSEIKRYQFQNNKLLSEVSFNEKLLVVRKEAFKDCIAITNIDLPSTAFDLEEGAFSNCSALTKVTIRSDAFNSFKQGVFQGCASLAEIEFNGLGVALSNVAEINKYAFEGTALTTIDYSKNLSIKTIGDRAFALCDKLVTANLEATNIATLGNELFYGCTSLVDVMLGSSVKTLPASLFALNYSESKDYAVGDVVVYNNNLYACTVANGPVSGKTNKFDETKWETTSVAEKQIVLKLSYYKNPETSTYEDKKDCVVTIPNSILVTVKTIKVREELVDIYKAIYSEYASLFEGFAPVTE